MATAKIPLRMKDQTTCIHHKGRQLDFYCEKCQELVCPQCLSFIHKIHPVCELSEISSQKEPDIRNFIDKTEKNDLVQIQKYINSTDKLFKRNKSTFEKLSQKLTVQTDKLKQDLDMLKEQTLSIYRKMEEDNAMMIKQYKQDLERYEKQLKQQVQECKIALQRGSHIQIFDTFCEIQSPSCSLPVKPVLGNASFTPNENPEDHLKIAVGKSFPPGQGQNSQVLEEWESPCDIESICTTTDGQVWTKADKTLTLLDRKGKVIQEVNHNVRINDISLSPTTHTLWVCDDKNNITELVSGRLTHRFSTKKEPECICITASNHVIVGMTKHISKFTTDGKMVCTTMATGTVKPLVCTTYRISECPLTHNVAVADFRSENDGGDGKGRVVVMDTDFKELFVYMGPQTGDEPFNPEGVVYDSVGNLIIGDSDNSRVLLISGRGEFLRVIHTDMDYLMSTVGIDSEDVLWVVLGGNIVKLLQYNSL